MLILIWKSNTVSEPDIVLAQSAHIDICQIIVCSFFKVRFVVDFCICSADFNWCGGCFGTDIVQNCTKSSNLGVHGLIFGLSFSKFQCACFWFEKMRKHDKMVEKTQTCRFVVKKIFEKLHASYQRWKKKIFRYNCLI